MKSPYMRGSEHGQWRWGLIQMECLEMGVMKTRIYQTNPHSTQIPCLAGTYQPSTGQAACLDATRATTSPPPARRPNAVPRTSSPRPARSHTSTPTRPSSHHRPVLSVLLRLEHFNQILAHPTSPTASTPCRPPVPTSGQTSQTPCAAGTTALHGPGRLPRRRCGAACPRTGPITVPAPGTYQPSTGQSACLDADPGHYTDSCPGKPDRLSNGHLQPRHWLIRRLGLPRRRRGPLRRHHRPVQPDALRRGHLPAIDRPVHLPRRRRRPLRRHHRPVQPDACAASTYQPSTGQSTCLDADMSHYVATTGRPARRPAPRAPASHRPARPPASTPTRATTSPPRPVQPDALRRGTTSHHGSGRLPGRRRGPYVATTGQSSQTPCAAGTYQPTTGQAACLDADASHHVAYRPARRPAPRPTSQLRINHLAWRLNGGSMSRNLAPPARHLAAWVPTTRTMRHRACLIASLHNQDTTCPQKAHTRRPPAPLAPTSPRPASPPASTQTPVTTSPKQPNLSKPHARWGPINPIPVNNLAVMPESAITCQQRARRPQPNARLEPISQTRTSPLAECRTRSLCLRIRIWCTISMPAWYLSTTIQPDIMHRCRPGILRSRPK